MEDDKSIRKICEDSANELSRSPETERMGE